MIAVIELKELTDKINILKNKNKLKYFLNRTKTKEKIKKNQHQARE